MPRKSNPAAQVESKYHHGDLRRAILEAAIELIQASGVQNLFLREIARTLGVTTAAPYHHFKDKEALLLAIALQGYEHLLQGLELARSSKPDAMLRLEAESRSYLRFAREYAAHYAVMFSSELTAERCSPLRTIADRCFAVVTVTIAETGLIRPQVSAEAGLCVWSMLHGIAMLDQSHLLEEAREVQERIAIQGVLGVVRGFSGE